MLRQRQAVDVGGLGGGKRAGARGESDDGEAKETEEVKGAHDGAKAFAPAGLCVCCVCA